MFAATSRGHGEEAPGAPPARPVAEQPEVVAPALDVIGHGAGEGIRSRLHFEEVETTLLNGAHVRVRTIRPEDKELLRRAFEHLSERSRRLRFMAPVARLSEEQLRQLTEVDFVDQFAWVAVRIDRPDELIGVARWVRVPDAPEIAEAAVTVADEHQGQGLGTLLLALLALSARAGSVTAIRAYVLPDNAPMLELLEELGAHVRFDSPGLLSADVPLEADLLPDAPAARVLKAFAAQVGEDPAADRQRDQTASD